MLHVVSSSSSHAAGSGSSNSSEQQRLWRSSSDINKHVMCIAGCTASGQADEGLGSPPFRRFGPWGHPTFDVLTLIALMNMIT